MAGRHPVRMPGEPPSSPPVARSAAHRMPGWWGAGRVASASTSPLRTDEGRRRTDESRTSTGRADEDPPMSVTAPDPRRRRRLGAVAAASLLALTVSGCSGLGRTAVGPVTYTTDREAVVQVNSPSVRGCHRLAPPGPASSRTGRWSTSSSTPPATAPAAGGVRGHPVQRCGGRERPALAQLHLRALTGRYAYAFAHRADQGGPRDHTGSAAVPAAGLAGPCWSVR